MCVCVCVCGGGGVVVFNVELLLLFVCLVCGFFVKLYSPTSRIMITFHCRIFQFFLYDKIFPLILIIFY